MKDSKKIDPSKVIKTQPRMVKESFPKEESKQQTIEEIVETLDTKQLDKLDIFLKGVQWKEEQDKKKYTEEEAEQIAKDAYEMGRKNLLIGVFNKWFNGIKKK